MVAAKKIRMRLPSAQFFVARAPNLDDSHFESLSAGGQTLFRVLEDDTDAILAAANVVLTASGTATVQTALHGTPMVIVYRVSPLEYCIGRRMVTLDTFGMVNLIAGGKIVPELIQHAFVLDN